jgi:[ribosomal protein S18]-alanine N-acetyltransferase
LRRDCRCGLIGFVEVKPSGVGAVDVGLGLRPEYTGRGLGVKFVQSVSTWVAERRSPARLVLRVARFNARAISVYERVGSAPVGTEVAATNARHVEFLRMERPPAT